jgi:integrase
MSIQKLENGKYRVWVRLVVDGTLRTLDRRVSTSKEAKLLKADFIQQCETNTLLADGNIKFKDYAQGWLDGLIGIQETTREGYQYKLQNVIPHLNFKIKDIKNSHIKNALRLLSKTKSKTTMQHCFKVTKQVFDQAVTDDLIHKNPCATFKRTTNMALDVLDKPKALTTDQQQKFISYLESEKSKGIYEHQLFIFGFLAFRTGMRRGELAALKWEDIDLAVREVDVNKAAFHIRSSKKVGIKSTKTKAGLRVIKLHKDDVSVIQEYKNAHAKFYLQHGIRFVHDWLFPTPNGDLTPVSLWSHRIADCMRRLEIPHTLHNLRHTHASNLLMNNFPLIQLSHRLGHADPHVTLKVYSHFVKGMEVQIEEYMEKLG